MSRPATILCIDDDEPSLCIRAKILQKLQYRVLCSTSPGQGLDLFARETVDAVILDYFMPGMNGADVARELKRRRPGVPILMLSSALFPPDDVNGMVDAFCAKLDGPATFLEALSRLLNHHADAP